MQLASLATRIDRDMQQHFGMSLGEYRIISVLEDGALPQAELCERIHCSAPTVSRWLKQLVRVGWVARHRPAHDRRELVVSVTRRGLNQLQRVHPGLAAVLPPMDNELALESKYLLVQLNNNLARFWSPSTVSTE